MRRISNSGLSVVAVACKPSKEGLLPDVRGAHSPFHNHGLLILVVFVDHAREAQFLATETEKRQGNAPKLAESESEATTTTKMFD